MKKGKIERELKILLELEPAWYTVILIEQLGPRYREALIEVVERKRAQLKELESKLYEGLEKLPEDLEISVLETFLPRLEALAKQEPHVKREDVIPFLEKLADLRLDIYDAAVSALRERCRAQDEQRGGHETLASALQRLIIRSSRSACRPKRGTNDETKPTSLLFSTSGKSAV